MLLLFALVAGSTTSWAVSNGDVFERISDATSLADGDEVIFVNQAETHACGTTQNTNNRTPVSITVTDHTYTYSSSDNVQVFVVKKNGNNFGFHTGSGYIYSASTSSNNLKTNTTAASTAPTTTSAWTLSSTTSSVFTVKNVGNTSYYLAFNGTSFFSQYKSGQSKPYIYKKRAVVAPAYTITAQSSNDEYGTVSLTGTVITGTPKSGCRYANPAYTVTSGTATVSQDGNEFTVTPSSDCTITINFEAIPAHTLSSDVSPAAAGTVTLGSTSVKEGSTTTATAAANAGYKFTGWSITGTGASLSSPTDNPTEVTMGTAEATVTANFEAVVTHQISWSVNGVIVKTDNVEDGAAIDFAAPASGIPTGYTFMGWVADRIDGTTDTDPANYVKAANATAEVTYYAVMAVGTESPVTAQLTADEIASNFASTAMAYDDKEKTYKDTDDGVTWGTRCITNKGRHWMQLKKDANVYIKASAAGAITEVSVTISNVTNKSGGIDDISMHGNFAGNVYLDNVQTTNTGEYGSGLNENIVSNVLTIVPSAASNTLYIHVDAAARIWNVDITYNGASYTGYCTTVPPVSVTVTSANYATYVSDFDLDFTGKGIKAYIAKADGTTGVSFTQVEKVPANTGVLLYKDGGTTEEIPVLSGAAEDVTGNVFIRGAGAAVVSVEGNLHNYILNNVEGVVGFYKAAGNTVATNRAYIQIDGSTLVKGFIALPGSDEETGIETMRNGENEKMSAIFDLSGRRVAKPTRGLYIVNGKKVLVK